MKKIIAFVICMFFTGGLIHADLIVHLTFDETLDDSSGNGNDGEFFGDVEPVYVEGFDEEAISFDGIDDYVKIIENTSLPVTGLDTFSIAVWVKGLPQADKRIFSESSSMQNHLLYNIGTNNTAADGTVDLYIRDDNGAAPVNHRHSTGIAFDDEWHHITWIDDNGMTSLYIDGALDSTDFNYTRPIMTPDTTTIGGILRESMTPQTCCFFMGAIDDVRIYDHALSEAEIKDLLPPCPTDNDTHCDGLEIIGPVDNSPGDYSVFVNDAVDESGDTIIYSFTADNGQGDIFESGPTTDNFYQFHLLNGTWTITSTVDDDLACPDDAADATCTEQVTVGCPTTGDTIIEEMTIEGPDNLPGTYLVTASGIQDDSGDTITCTFTADNGEDAPLVYVVQNIMFEDSVSALFTLGAGNWTISATVDDSLLCDDTSPEGTKTQQLTIEAQPQALVSHWSFDEDINDSTATGNDGIFMGDTADPDFVEGFDANPEGAIAFDGISDYVEIPQDNGLPIYANKAYSVCMWVNGPPADADQVPPVNIDCRVFSEGNSDPDSFGINPLFNIGTNNSGAAGNPDVASLNIFIRNDDGSLPINHIKSQLPVFDNTWHHIAWTDNNGKAILYVDGIRDAGDFNYTRGKLSVNTSTIGAILRLMPSYFFQGSIDDVRVYNYALTHEEVLALVPEPEGCPADGDTHSGGISVSSPDGGTGPGIYTLQATGATDDSGDPIIYTFTAEDENGAYIQSGPSESDTADIYLSPGTWTLTVAVDDDLLCRDVAADSKSSTEVTVKKELVVHLPFDGDLDDAGQFGNDGVMINGLDPVFTEGHDGTPDGAISLDGTTEFVNITHNHGLPITANRDFSIAMWVKGPYTQADRRIFSEASTMNDSPLYNLGTHNQAADGTLDNYIRGDNGAAPVNHRHSQQIVFDDSWHHIAWVQQNNQVVLYVDGVVDGTNFNFTKPVQTFDTTTIGGILRAAPSHYFQGAIDDVFIYNYALTAAEVDELFTGGNGGDKISVFTGDTNNDGSVNLADAITVLSYLFAGGQAPPCKKTGDCNNDGAINLADAITVLSYQFAGGSLSAPDGSLLGSADIGCIEYDPAAVDPLGCETPCAK